MKKIIVSLGGWCGPALVLSKLGLRNLAFPFDFCRCTLDGVIQFVERGFDDSFFPAGGRPYIPECVGPYVLFRGQHTAFAHFDLNSDEVLEGFQRKFDRFFQLLDTGRLSSLTPQDGRIGNRSDHSTIYGPGGSTVECLFPSVECGDCGAADGSANADVQHDDRWQYDVLFLRTVTARFPQEELALARVLESKLLKRNPYLSFQIVFVVHDQGLVAPVVELAPMSSRIRVWILEYETSTEGLSLLDRTETGYKYIIQQVLNDKKVSQNPFVSAIPGRAHTERLDFPFNFNTNAYFDVDHQQWLPRSTIRAEPVANSCMTVSKFPWRAHDNLALIDGVASVGGTCTGVGSTKMVIQHPFGEFATPKRSCAYCGNTDFHKSFRPYGVGVDGEAALPFSVRDDALLLSHLYLILQTGADKIAIIDRLASQLQRGAFEIVSRLRYLATQHPRLLSGAPANGCPLLDHDFEVNHPQIDP